MGWFCGPNWPSTVDYCGDFNRILKRVILNRTGYILESGRLYGLYTVFLIIECPDAKLLSSPASLHKGRGTF